MRGKFRSFEGLAKKTRESIVSERFIEYCNHFAFGSHFSIKTKDLPYTIQINCESKLHEVLISSVDTESIAEMSKLINQFNCPKIPEIVVSEPSELVDETSIFKQQAVDESESQAEK